MKVKAIVEAVYIGEQEEVEKLLTALSEDILSGDVQIYSKVVAYSEYIDYSGRKDES